MTDIRMTMSTRAALEFFLLKPRTERYGFEIAKYARVDRGAIYGILSRLEEIGWIASRWEKVDAKEAGRPERRYYRFRPGGAQAAISALAAADRRQSR